MPATTAAGGLSAWPMAAPTASIASREILRDFSIMMASYYFCAPAARCRDFRRRPQIPARIDRRSGRSRRIISLNKDPDMLAYLDTLIGFAVVMLGASLLITILTQMASALFSADMTTTISSAFFSWGDILGSVAVGSQNNEREHDEKVGGIDCFVIS